MVSRSIVLPFRTDFSYKLAGLNSQSFTPDERLALATNTNNDLPTRQSLLARLRNVGDSESWRTFFETYWRLIYNVARKSGLSDDQAQDVVQDTLIAVARRMPDFRYDRSKGSFKQWLLLICRRRIQDQLRRMYSARQFVQQNSEEASAAVENMPDTTPLPDAQIDSDWDQQWRDNVFQMALARVRQRANPKHYQAFECCVVQGMRASEAAAMLNLSPAEIYLAKHRISAAVKRAVKEVEAELIYTTPSDLSKKPRYLDR